MNDSLRLTSPAFKSGEAIPPRFTSDGDNISPPLMIDGVSDQAKSLALIVDDPDAATDPDGPGQTFDHWVVFNIPPTTTEIPEDSVPAGAVVGQNGMGSSQHVGPAPPNGTHRYYFKLYELSSPLDLDETATKEEVEAAMEGQVIGRTELVGTYQRQGSN